MPFRDRFDCLWCGTPHVVRAASDLEGWAQLCPTCLGKAGTNPFLRGRLRTALADRARSGPSTVPTSPVPAAEANTGPWRPASRAAATTSAPSPRPATPAFPDDWFLRRGPFEHGAIHDTAWAAELDVVTRWLDALPLSGRIDEPGAGTGFFSPLLAEKGELHASDEDGAALDVARDRLVAHRLLAHLHVADPWAASLTGSRADAGTSGADAVVASFLVGRVRGAGLDRALTLLRDRLVPGGVLALVELRPDPQGGPPPGTPWTWHDPLVLEAGLVRAGFGEVDMTTTGRFFLLASARAR